MPGMAPERDTPLTHAPKHVSLESLSLPGDDLLGEPAEPITQITESTTIHAPPEAVWPWLVQMGADRAGFYAIDFFDRQGEPSAREIHHA